jgi:hypothetical protein
VHVYVGLKGVLVSLRLFSSITLEIDFGSKANKRIALEAIFSIWNLIHCEIKEQKNTMRFVLEIFLGNPESYLWHMEPDWFFSLSSSKNKESFFPKYKSKLK